ncbi:MAG: rod shape-determining protein RodA [Candidatus Hydrogenedentota bacterium]
MSSVTHDIDIMDAHIGVFNYRNLFRADRILMMLALALVMVGLLTLYSASRSASSEIPYYVKQLVYFGVGAVVAAVIVSFDYRFLISFAPFFYVLCLVLLILVEFFGITVKGGQRWLGVGPFTFQPSEFTKLGLVYMLAWYFHTVQHRIRSLPFFLLAFVIAGIPIGLILRQPNLGTAALLGPVLFVMLYVAGCKRWHLVAVVIVGLAAIPVAWTQLEDYQKERVLTFGDPAADARGDGWQTVQTMITVGSGGMWGKGFREGTQTHLSFLPEHHTDFIFALLAEEMGFQGAVVVLALFGALLWRGLVLAQGSPELQGTLVGVGAVTILALHVFVNIAITIGLMPVTGIPLPFLSYGGTFYLTTMMCVGAMLSVNVRRGMFSETEGG